MSMVPLKEESTVSPSTDLNLLKIPFFQASPESDQDRGIADGGCLLP